LTGQPQTSCGSPTSPSIPPGKASCTAVWCWMCSPAGWWGLGDRQPPGHSAGHQRLGHGHHQPQPAASADRDP
jgi:hypothetical protein